jgi:gliding motility-associated-like protein
VTTVTTLLPSDAVTVSATTCNPDEAGTETITLTNQYGCDSLVTTVTTLLPSDAVTVNATTCDPAEIGTETITLTNQYGCDSLVTTTVTLLLSYNQVIQDTSCNPSDTGTFVHYLNTSQGCDSIITEIIALEVAPDVDAGEDVSICSGQQAVLIASGAVDYSWWPSNGLDTVTGPVVNASPVQTTTYTVTGSAEVCTNTDTVTVTVHSLPSMSAGQNQEVCHGESVTLSGLGEVTYEWDNGVQNGVPFIPNTTTTYTLTGTDEFGCQSNVYVTVVVYPLPEINAGQDVEVCAGSEVVLSASEGTEYIWNHGVQDGIPFIVEETTTFIVQGSDIHGCYGSDTLELSVIPVGHTYESAWVCSGTTVTWPDNSTSVIALGDSGRHVFTLSSTESGCDSIVELDLNVGPAYEILNHVSICRGEMYQLPDGLMTGSAGSYSYTATTGDGCDSVIVTEISLAGPDPIADPMEDILACTGDLPVILDISRYDGSQFQWMNGTQGPVLSVMEAGEYVVELLQSNGCVTFDTIGVSLEICEAPCQLLAPSAFTPDDDLANDVFYILDNCDIELEQFDLRIYNRWGELLYETDNIAEGWNGKMRNTAVNAPMDVYVYYCEYMFRGESKAEAMTGTITLIR